MNLEQLLRGMVLTIFVASMVLSIVALLIGAHDWGSTATMPALFFAVWMFGGHLVTLDDDSPGGWSNPDGSREIWRQSLRQLAIKFFVLLGVASLYFLHK